jgi:hypothetical protein
MVWLLTRVQQNLAPSRFRAVQRQCRSRIVAGPGTCPVRVIAPTLTPDAPSTFPPSISHQPSLLLLSPLPPASPVCCDLLLLLLLPPPTSPSGSPPLNHLYCSLCAGPCSARWWMPMLNLPRPEKRAVRFCSSISCCIGSSRDEAKEGGSGVGQDGSSRDEVKKGIPHPGYRWFPLLPTLNCFVCFF